MSKQSIYHILHKIPAIYPEDIQVEYEKLAWALVHSGRVRIDTDYYCNFVRYNDVKNNIYFIASAREINEPALIEKTKQYIRSLYIKKKKQITETKISSIIEELKNKLSRNLSVSDTLEIQLVRILVQAAHPIVIKWILLYQVEIFITYSKNIGDLMDIPNWKAAGTNSGMQSTDGVNVCIYVSCGGDPFEKNDLDNPIYGNGWAALARMQIIAGQEIGHFADIKRNDLGEQIDRHSANFACTRPKEHVAKARLNDIQRCDNLLKSLNDHGMHNLIYYEERLKFFHAHKIFGIKRLFVKIMVLYYEFKLFNYVNKSKQHHFIKLYKNEKYIGLMIRAMIIDMQSHLNPIADVYKREDSIAEEAIACAESLARVPQQVMKWGHLTTKATMHDLYSIYYQEVIPSLIKVYSKVTNTHYKRDYSMPQKTLWTKLLQFFTNFQRSKTKFKPVRDLPSL